MRWTELVSSWRAACIDSIVCQRRRQRGGSHPERLCAQPPTARSAVPALFCPLPRACPLPSQPCSGSIVTPVLLAPQRRRLCFRIAPTGCRADRTRQSAHSHGAARLPTGAPVSSGRQCVAVLCLCLVLSPRSLSPRVPGVRRRALITLVRAESEQPAPQLTAPSAAAAVVLPPFALPPRHFTSQLWAPCFAALNPIPKVCCLQSKQTQI